MAGLQELHSFMGKFVNLWKNGFEANLRIQTKAGRATISMEVELGEAFPPRKPGPSRLRRSERRAEARRLAEEATAQESTAEKAAAGKAKAKHASAEDAQDENARVEDAKADEPNVEETVAAEEATEVGKVSRGDAAKAPTPGLDVNDELCSNQMYSQGKPTPTPSPSATPTSRKVGGFDYWTLEYDSD